MVYSQLGEQISDETTRADFSRSRLIAEPCSRSRAAPAYSCPRRFHDRTGRCPIAGGRWSERPAITGTSWASSGGRVWLKTDE